MSDKNPFGGSNPHSAYVPLTDTERATIQKLIDTHDLRLIIHGWGYVNDPPVILGEGRVSVLVDMSITAPEVPIYTSVLDLELQTQAGLTLFRKQELCEVNGLPIPLSAGMHLSMSWEIQVHHIDPKVVKMLSGPLSALGLTSTRLDKDTKEPTLMGNMHLRNPLHRQLLHYMDEGEKAVREQDRQVLIQKKGLSKP